jgi:hypothetical protein
VHRIASLSFRTNDPCIFEVPTAADPARLRTTIAFFHPTLRDLSTVPDNQFMPQSTPAADARRLSGTDGLCIEIYDHGCVRRMDHGATMINLFLAHALEAGPTNLYLRSRSASGSLEFAR